MLQEKLVQLVIDLQRWQQLAQANPSTLDVGDNQRRQVAIVEGLSFLEKTIAQWHLDAMIAEEVFVFVYQIREELVRTGLATGYGRFVQLIRYVWEYAQRVEGNATMIKESCDQERLQFRNTDLTDAQKFVTELEANYKQPLVDHKGELINEEDILIQQIEADEVLFLYEIKLQLAQQENKVYCTEYHYYLELEGIVPAQKLKFNWKKTVH